MTTARLAALCILAATSVPSAAQRQPLPQYQARVAGKPLKISIRSSARVVAVNESIDLVVSLLDGNGQPAKAMDLVQVNITVTEPSGKSLTLTVTINKSSQSQTRPFIPATP